MRKVYLIVTFIIILQTELICEASPLSLFSGLVVTGTRDNTGVKVIEVGKDSFSEKSGIKIGDVITNLGDDKIESLESYIKYSKEAKYNDDVQISVLRDEKIANVAVSRNSSIVNKELNAGYDEAQPDHMSERNRIRRKQIKHEEQAAWYCYQGKYRLSISEANRALEIDPKSYDAYLLKGMACQGSGRIEEAIEAYKAFLNYDPTSADGYYFIKGELGKLNYKLNKKR